MMRPFRAPRTREVETASKARRKDTPQIDTEDSEGPTELRVTRWVVPETQDVDLHNADNKSDTNTDRDDVGDNGQVWTIEARNKCAEVEAATETATSFDAPSPCLSEFELFLEKEVLEKQQKNDKELPKKQQTNDEFWEGVLQSELKRFNVDTNFRLVPVEEMMVGASSDDDDVPIVQTLPQRASQLSLLASLATASASSPNLRKKRTKKSLWTYVTVHEPTGVTSNYWDTNAPSARRTKQIAKEKISALHQSPDKGEGTLLHLKFQVNPWLKISHPQKVPLKLEAKMVRVIMVVLNSVPHVRHLKCQKEKENNRNMLRSHRSLWRKRNV